MDSQRDTADIFFDFINPSNRPETLLPTPTASPLPAIEAVTTPAASTLPLADPLLATQPVIFPFYHFGKNPNGLAILEELNFEAVVKWHGATQPCLRYYLANQEGLLVSSLIAPWILSAIRPFLPASSASQWPKDLESAYQALLEHCRPRSLLGRLIVLKRHADWHQPVTDIYPSLHRCNLEFQRWQQALELTDEETLFVYTDSIHGEPLGSFARRLVQALRFKLELATFKAQLVNKALELDNLSDDGIFFTRQSHPQQYYPHGTNHHQQRGYLPQQLPMNPL
jgi:hypothetical protein